MPLIRIQFTEDEIKHIKTSQNACETAEVAFSHASWVVKETRRKLWEEIVKLYPDCDSKGAVFQAKEGLVTYFKEE